jgi:hypothetical protein
MFCFWATFTHPPLPDNFGLVFHHALCFGILCNTVILIMVHTLVANGLLRQGICCKAQKPI